MTRYAKNLRGHAPLATPMHRTWVHRKSQHPAHIVTSLSGIDFTSERSFSRYNCNKTTISSK